MVSESNYISMSPNRVRLGGRVDVRGVSVWVCVRLYEVGSRMRARALVLVCSNVRVCISGVEFFTG